MAANTANETRHYDTIVLGAGMAGLACASRLFQDERFRQKNSLLVLEGRDRIGGRIGSVSVKGSRLDTGANWIHGTGTKDRPNPLMAILPHKRYRELEGGVIFQAPDITNENSEIAILTNKAGSEAGDQIIPAAVCALLQEDRWSLFGKLHEMAASTPANEAKHISVFSALTKTSAFRDSFKDLPEEYHATYSAMPQFIETIEAGPLVAESAEYPESVAGLTLSEYAIEDYEGDQVFLQDGFTAVIDELAKDILAAGILQLNTEIKTIHWSNQLIKIETTNGTTYTANGVVCTLPLGVLKHQQSTLFQPPLPESKQTAISSLGFGTLDKIFLVYENPWWDQEPYLSTIRKGLPDQIPDNFTGFTSSLQGLSISPDGTAKPGPRLLSLINLHALTGFPVLSAFVSCSNALEVEAQSDEAAASLVQSSLSEWFGRSVPKPDLVHVTRWKQDVFARGSYSFMIKGLSEKMHREEFARAEGEGRLRFAGEHTGKESFATVHAALESGWREAEGVLGMGR